ncbi:hypothetical protein FOA52_000792 [Chlamydomonas sp. UWO 241]|nr:hypothetical protein FOA52_000792 [Chlamydomonas sp. UWO 241]
MRAVAPVCGWGGRGGAVYAPPSVPSTSSRSCWPSVAASKQRRVRACAAHVDQQRGSSTPTARRQLGRWDLDDPFALPNLAIHSTEASRQSDEAGEERTHWRPSLCAPSVKLPKGINELCATIISQAHAFDAHACATAAARLAKLYRSAVAQLKSRGGAAAEPRSHEAHEEHELGATRHALRHERVLPAMAALDAQLPRLLPDYGPWHASQCLWAMSAVGCYERAAFDALCGRCVAASAAMRPVHCAMVMLAFGRLKHYHPELLRVIPQVMLRELDHAKPSDVSSALWGYAKLRVPGSPGKVFLQAASDHLACAIDTYSCQELVQVLWACAKLGHYPGQSALLAAEARLLERCALLTPQDAANALWAFSVLHHKPAGLLDALPLAFGRRLGAFKPQELSCVLHSYVSARHYHAGLLDAAAPLLLLRARRLSHADVVVALRAYGLFGHRPRIDARALAAAAAWELSQGGGIGAGGGGGGGGGGGSIWSGIDIRGGGMGVGGSARGSGSGREASPLPRPPPPVGSSSSSCSSGASPPSPSPEPQSRGGAATREHDARSCDALSTLVAALAANTRRRLPYLRPRALTALVSALAGVRHASCPRCDLRGLAAEAGRLAAARACELRPHELSALLYGLSSLGVGELSAYHACVRQLTRALEDSDAHGALADGRDGRRGAADGRQPYHHQQQYGSHRPSGAGGVTGGIAGAGASGGGGGGARRGAITVRLLTSVVHSCVSVGYTPWSLIEGAALRGMALRADPASMATRWRLPTRTPPVRRLPNKRTNKELWPSYDNSREECLALQLEALKHNNFDPARPGVIAPDHGIEVLYRFGNFSPFERCRYFGRSLDLGQFERFRHVMHSAPYATLRDHQSVEVLSELEVGEHEWRQRARVVGLHGREEHTYEFVLVQRVGGRYDGYWFMEQLLCDDQWPTYN